MVVGRLHLGYLDASAALWTMAALAALVLAASRALPRLARPPLLASSGFLLGLAVLAQSRGWLYTLPVVGLAARPPLLVYALPVGTAVALALPQLLEPHDVAGARAAADVAGPLHDSMGGRRGADRSGRRPARARLTVWGEGRLDGERGRRRVWRSRRVAAARVVGVLVTGAVTALVATRGDPVDSIDTAWAEFEDFRSGSGVGGSRFGDLSSVRYDF